MPPWTCWPWRKRDQWTELARASAYLLRGQMAFASGHSTDSPSLLLEATRRFETLDAQLARETYLDAPVCSDVRGASGRRAQAAVALERRQRRRADVRAQLRTAYEMLETMGLAGFAGRPPR